MMTSADDVQSDGSSNEGGLWPKMLAAGTLVRPIDLFDLLLHGIPWLLVLAKLGRPGWVRLR